MYTKANAGWTASPKGRLGGGYGRFAGRVARPARAPRRATAWIWRVLAARYRSGSLTPLRLVDEILARIEARGDDHVWIHRLSRDELVAYAGRLQESDPSAKPLYGVPFAIKDNIDLADHPTTAGCPDFAYVAQDSAPVVRRLIDAGAIPIGKTNLDQFATGLNGTRSPYGAPTSVFSTKHVSGGSSSGSAVAVAAGLVTFSLGTDTAGSGRVPAAFNNIVGLKPTRGLLSIRGVVPACRSLDCVSIFALTAGDACDVLAVAQGFDAADPFSRRAAIGRPCPRIVKGTRFGTPRPSQLEFFGNSEGERLFGETLRRIERLGGELVEIDFGPFLETARLLYEGPWVAERYVAIRDFIDRRPEALHPVTRQIIAGGAKSARRRRLFRVLSAQGIAADRGAGVAVDRRSRSRRRRDVTTRSPKCWRTRSS